MVEIRLDEGQTICPFCKNNGLLCREPSMPLIPGRLELNLEGTKVGINFERMAECAKRIALLAEEEVVVEIQGEIQRTLHDVEVNGKKERVSIIDMGQGRYRISLGRQNFGFEIEAIQVDKAN